MENGTSQQYVLLRQLTSIIDVASYEKEAQQEPDSPNLVAYLLAHGIDGREFTTPFEAQMFLRSKIEHYEDMFYEATSAALSDKELQESNDAQRWLSAMQYAA